ncbi:MmcQ/YjbR family DNA-binding protein [Candidatus Saccharibacteria bacterium]|nr:MmcQ/YjbR family DNA-binding protein [Candidatus Saccharibacteria bacterium]
MYDNIQTSKIIDYIKSEYGAEPEFLWPERSPDYCIFRHSVNRKWFALIGTAPYTTLGINKDGKANIINLKFDKNQTYDFAETNDHIFPAYHMNKNNWITIWLDGTLPDELVFELIKKSYLLSDK